MTRPTRLSTDAQRVLGSMEVEGNLARLPGEQLPRPLYLEVNEALSAIGGKWSRGKKAHVFAGDPRDALDQIILDGTFADAKKSFEFFPTPDAVVDELLRGLELRSGARVLEPSAGRGAIARRLRALGLDVTCIELMAENADALETDGFAVVRQDFLTWMLVEPFDAVVMNPPFSRQQDVDHVVHAWSCLRDGGTLAAVMSGGVQFRGNAKTVAFRAFVEAQGGAITPLPDGAFLESGTAVNTVTVTLQKRTSAEVLEIASALAAGRTMPPPVAEHAPPKVARDRAKVPTAAAVPEFQEIEEACTELWEEIVHVANAQGKRAGVEPLARKLVAVVERRFPRPAEQAATPKRDRGNRTGAPSVDDEPLREPEYYLAEIEKANREVATLTRGLKRELSSCLQGDTTETITAEPRQPSLFQEAG